VDFGAGLAGIERDLREFLAFPAGIPIVVLTVALPLVSLALLIRRRRLALVPLLISVALLAEWFLYYATDWWSNPGQGAWAPAFLLVLVGWLLVIAEVRRLRGQA
jgi:hypothetical protein